MIKRLLERLEWEFQNMSLEDQKFFTRVRDQYELDGQLDSDDEQRLRDLGRDFRL